MSKKIAVLATLDTKGSEALYIKALLAERGIEAIIIDLGIFDNPTVKPDITREDILRELSIDPVEFQRRVRMGSLRRDEAIKTIGIGAGKVLSKMLKELGGVIGIGGNQGSAAASIAMRALPIGIPKVLVSTVASGNIRPYIEYKDIVVMFSVSDVEFGPNTISKTILMNAVNALVGMVTGYKGFDIDEGVKRIAITTLGSTGGLTRRCVSALKELGYEPIVFHASGAGGSAMEELIEQGFFNAVLDLNLHELVGEVVPDDIYRPMKPRLINAVNLRMPLVITPGSINYLVFGPPDSIPQKYLMGRKIHYHNPYNTNVRLSKEELLKVADHLISKLLNASREVTLVLPTKGFSALDIEGGPLYEPDHDMMFIDKVKEGLSDTLNLVKVDKNINDPEVADIVIKYLKKQLK